MPDRNQLDRLQRIIETQALIVQAEWNLDRFMQVVVDTLQELTQARGAVVELIDGAFMEYRYASGLIAPHVGLRLRRDGSLSGLCVETGETLRSDDTEQDARVDREACRKAAVRSMVCTPLFRIGEPVGVLKVMSDRAADFDGDDVQTLSLLAGVLGAALGKQLAFDQLHNAEMRTRTLLENASDAIISIDEEGNVKRWNNAAERLFGANARSVLEQPLTALGGLGTELSRLFALESSAVHTSAWQEVELQETGITAEINLTRNRFGQASELTLFVHDVTARKRMEMAMCDMALSDGLTGLANRRKMMDMLEHAVECGRRGRTDMALLFMDINDFKAINDLYGHETGDCVLLEFAKRLRGCVRAADLLARLGGDEFVILAEGLAGEDEALGFAHKIAAAMDAPLGDSEISLSSSIGIAMYHEQDDALGWLRQADRAMYQAKHHGGLGTRIAVYTQGSASAPP